MYDILTKKTSKSVFRVRIGGHLVVLGIGVDVMAIEYSSLFFRKTVQNQKAWYIQTILTARL